MKTGSKNRRCRRRKSDKEIILSRTSSVESSKGSQLTTWKQEHSPQSNRNVPRAYYYTDYSKVWNRRSFWETGPVNSFERVNPQSYSIQPKKSTRKLTTLATTPTLTYSGFPFIKVIERELRKLDYDDFLSKHSLEMDNTTSFNFLKTCAVSSGIITIHPSVCSSCALRERSLEGISDVNLGVNFIPKQAVGEPCDSITDQFNSKNYENDQAENFKDVNHANLFHVYPVEVEKCCNCSPTTSAKNLSQAKKRAMPIEILHRPEKALYNCRIFAKNSPKKIPPRRSGTVNENRIQPKYKKTINSAPTKCTARTESLSKRNHKGTSSKGMVCSPCASNVRDGNMNSIRKSQPRPLSPSKKTFQKVKVNECNECDFKAMHERKTIPKNKVAGSSSKRSLHKEKVQFHCCCDDEMRRSASKKSNFKFKDKDCDKDSTSFCHSRTSAAKRSRSPQKTKPETHGCDTTTKKSQDKTKDEDFCSCDIPRKSLQKEKDTDCSETKKLRPKQKRQEQFVTQFHNMDNTFKRFSQKMKTSNSPVLDRKTVADENITMTTTTKCCPKDYVLEDDFCHECIEEICKDSFVNSFKLTPRRDLNKKCTPRPPNPPFNAGRLVEGKKLVQPVHSAPKNKQISQTSPQKSTEPKKDIKKKPIETKKPLESKKPVEAKMSPLMETPVCGECELIGVKKEEEEPTPVAPEPVQIETCPAGDTLLNIEETVKSQDSYLNEVEYLHFLLRVSEDILLNNYHTNSDIEDVFTNHMEANKGLLDMEKMLQHLKEFKKEIKYPFQPSRQKMQASIYKTIGELLDKDEVEKGGFGDTPSLAETPVFISTLDTNINTLVEILGDEQDAFRSQYSVAESAIQSYIEQLEIQVPPQTDPVLDKPLEGGEEGGEEEDNPKLIDVPSDDESLSSSEGEAEIQSTDQTEMKKEKKGSLVMFDKDGQPEGKKLADIALLRALHRSVSDTLQIERRYSLDHPSILKASKYMEEGSLSQNDESLVQTTGVPLTSKTLSSNSSIVSMSSTKNNMVPSRDLTVKEDIAVDDEDKNEQSEQIAGSNSSEISFSKIDITKKETLEKSNNIVKSLSSKTDSSSSGSDVISYIPNIGAIKEKFTTTKLEPDNENSKNPTSKDNPVSTPMKQPNDGEMLHENPTDNSHRLSVHNAAFQKTDRIESQSMRGGSADGSDFITNESHKMETKSIKLQEIRRNSPFLKPERDDSVVRTGFLNCCFKKKK